MDYYWFESSYQLIVYWMFTYKEPNNVLQPRRPNPTHFPIWTPPSPKKMSFFRRKNPLKDFITKRTGPELSQCICKTPWYTIQNVCNFGNESISCRARNMLSASSWEPVEPFELFAAPSQKAHFCRRPWELPPRRLRVIIFGPQCPSYQFAWTPRNYSRRSRQVTQSASYVTLPAIIH